MQVAQKNNSVIDQNAVMMFTLLGISCSTHSVTYDPTLILMLSGWGWDSLIGTYLH